MLAAIFGWWNLHGIGPGAALLHHTPCRSGALAAIGRWNHHGNRAEGGPPTMARPRHDFRAAEPSRQSGRGRPSYNCGSTRKGQAVVVMPINWQQPRTGAFMPSGCSPRFSSGGTITAIGPGAALLHGRGTPVGAAPSPRLSGGTITAIGPRAALLHGRGTPVGAAPSPRFSGGGNITAIGPGAALLQWRGLATIFERRKHHGNRAGGGSPAAEWMIRVWRYHSTLCT